MKHSYSFSYSNCNNIMKSKLCIYCVCMNLKLEKVQSIKMKSGSETYDTKKRVVSRLEFWNPVFKKTKEISELN